MPSASTSPRLLHAAALPPSHAWRNSAAARFGSAVTAAPSLYKTPRLRHASQSFARHLVSSVLTTSVADPEPDPVPAPAPADPVATNPPPLSPPLQAINHATATTTTARIAAVLPQP